MIRIDAIWLAIDPIDLRAGMDSALGRVVSVFGAAHPHHAYVFLNQPLLAALTRAFYWQQLLDDGVVASGSDIARREVSMIAPLEPVRDRGIGSS